MKIIIISFLLLVLSSCSASYKDTAVQPDLVVEPDNSRILYVGRVDFTEKDSPSLSWPATQIAINFTGTAVSVILDDERGKNHYNAFIDENWDEPVILSLKQGVHTYTIASTLEKTRHTLRLYKRTEGHEGKTTFKGFVLNPKAKLEKPPKRKKRLIEIFGDSITSGMGNEALLEAPDNKPYEKNSFLSYGAITARNFNAEFVSTSLSGIGIMKSYFPYVMPQYYNQLNATGVDGPSWDFSQYRPDLVVVNLFQNDSTLFAKMENPPNDEQRIQAYQSFLTTLRSKYPDTYIICSLGSMNATKPGSPWPNYIKQAVYRLNQQGDEKIDTLFFDFDGYSRHPRVRHHQKNAEKLTRFISKKLNW